MFQKQTSIMKNKQANICLNNIHIRTESFSNK